MTMTLGQRAVEVIAATSSATGVPDGDTEAINLHQFPVVRTFCEYEGTVETCALRAWVQDEVTGTWYEGPSTDDLDPLTPGGASPINEARDWAFGVGAKVWFQVEVITGGGTVAIRVQAVAA